MKSEETRLAEVLPVIQEQLKQGFSVQIFPQGISMRPMLYGGRDSVILSPLSGAVGKNDIILYRRRSGQYVLHRVIGEKDGACICCGDNQYQKEWPVEQDQIIARVTGFTRKGRHFETTELGYRIYCKMLPIRRRCKAMKHLVLRCSSS